MPRNTQQKNTRHKDRVLLSCVTFLLSIMMSVIMMSVIMMSVIMMSVIMLSVIIMSVIMMNVIVMCHYDECHYTGCHCAIVTGIETLSLMLKCDIKDLETFEP